MEVLSHPTKDFHQKMSDEHEKNPCSTMVVKGVGFIKKRY
jgi:hypothetical protein